MKHRLRSAPLVVLAAGTALSALVACSPQPDTTVSAQPSTTQPASQPTSQPVPQLGPNTERLPGVEVEVLAAQRGGRGDVGLVFLIGRDGRAEKLASLSSLRPPALVEPYDGPIADPKPLTREQARSVTQDLWDTIIAGTTPEVFDVPEGLDPWQPFSKRPWRRLDPPIRLRVGADWFAQPDNTLFDGSWVMLTSPPPEIGERIVLNVIAWRPSDRRSQPIELLLSRGFLPEAQFAVPLHDPGSPELRLALADLITDEPLPDVFVPTPHGDYGGPWHALSGPLRIEIDGAWLADQPIPSAGRWVPGEPPPPRPIRWSLVRP